MTSYRQSFEQAVAAALAGATVLTANTRGARAIRSAAESKLRRTSAAWLTPDVVPYGVFIERLHGEAVISGLLSEQRLGREQELQLWRRILERSAVARQTLLPESAAVLASDGFRTAVEYGIPLNSAQMSVSSETRAFAQWAAEYRQQLTAHHWTSAALLSGGLEPVLSELHLPQQVAVFLGAESPAQRRFLDALGASGVDLLRLNAWDDEGGSAVRCEFDGMSEEVRAAAQWARAQVEANPAARVGVIFFDLERRQAQVESVFRAVLNPELLLGAGGDAAFEIALPRALSEYAIVRVALDLLALVAAPIDFERLERVLRSPYLAEDGDAAARFVTRMRRHARREVGFEDLLHALEEGSELPELRRRLAALVGVARGVQTPSYWAVTVRRILEVFGWPGNAALGSEEFQCTASWRDLVGEIAALDLLDWRADLAEFVQRLERMAESVRFKPESLGAPVQIMSVEEAEGSCFDALWIASASDELWPSVPRMTPLIPLALLRAAGAPVPSSAAAQARTEALTRRLLRAAPEVILSLARRTDDEREQRWSPLFSGIEKGTAMVIAEDSVAALFASAALESLVDESAPALGEGERARGGTWLLEEQSNCPFRAFAIRRLLARESEGPNEALAANERGKIVELALQRLWECIEDSRGLRRMDLRERVAEAVDAAMSELLTPSSDPWIVRFRQLERERTIVVIGEWLELESRRPEFRVRKHQHEVKLRLAGLDLSARIDRIDQVSGGELVIDYKTGRSNAPSAWTTPRPRMPQLPFYALALREEGADVAGIAFASVRKGESAFKAYLREPSQLPCSSPAKRDFEGAGFDDYLPRWGSELERLAHDFVCGRAEADPKIPPGKSNSSCERCHLGGLCRIGESFSSDETLTEGDEDE